MGDSEMHNAPVDLPVDLDGGGEAGSNGDGDSPSNDRPRTDRGPPPKLASVYVGALPR